MHNLVGKILAFLYFLCLLAISLSFFDSSHALFIVPVSLGLTLFFARYSYIESPSENNFPSPLFYLYLILIFLTLFSYQLTTNFIFGQDAISAYLPLSRYFASFQTYQGAIPIANSPDLYTTSHGYPPLLITLGGILFQLTHLTSENLTSFIPFAFAFLLLLLFFDNGINTPGKLLMLLVVLTFTPSITMSMSWFYQDLPLSVFTLAAFIFLMKYSDSENSKYYILSFLASSLAALTKYPGLLVLMFILLHGLTTRALLKRRILLLCLLFVVAPVLWYSRNIYLFHTPTPPITMLNFSYLESMKGWLPFLKEKTLFTTNFEYYQEFWERYVATQYPTGFLDVIEALSNVWILPLTAVLFLFYRKQWRRVHVFVLLFAIAYLLSWLNSGLYSSRLLMPLFVLALYASIKITGKASATDWVPVWKNFILRSLFDSRAFHTVLIIFCLVTTFYVSQIYIGWARNLRKDYETIIADLSDTLVTNPGRKALIDTDYGFKWYSQTYVLEYIQVYPAAGLLHLLEGEMTLREFFEKYRIAYVIDSPHSFDWEAPLYSLLKQYPRKREIYSRALRYRGKTMNFRVWAVEYQ